MEFEGLSCAGRLQEPKNETVIKHGKHQIWNLRNSRELGDLKCQSAIRSTRNRKPTTTEFRTSRALGDFEGQNARLSRKFKTHNPQNRPRPDVQTTSSFDKGASKFKIARSGGAHLPCADAVPPHPQSLLLASLS